MPTPQSRCWKRCAGQLEPPRKHLHIPKACGQQAGKCQAQHPRPALAAVLETGLRGMALRGRLWTLCNLLLWSQPPPSSNQDSKVGRGPHLLQAQSALEETGSTQSSLGTS